jgi:hypothetical protein
MLLQHLPLNVLHRIFEHYDYTKRNDLKKVSREFRDTVCGMPHPLARFFKMKSPTGPKIKGRFRNVVKLAKALVDERMTLEAVDLGKEKRLVLALNIMRRDVNSWDTMLTNEDTLVARKNLEMSLVKTLVRLFHCATKLQILLMRLPIYNWVCNRIRSRIPVTVLFPHVDTIEWEGFWYNDEGTNWHDITRQCPDLYRFHFIINQLREYSAEEVFLYLFGALQHTAYNSVHVLQLSGYFTGCVYHQLDDRYILGHPNGTFLEWVQAQDFTPIVNAVRPLIERPDFEVRFWVRHVLPGYIDGAIVFLVELANGLKDARSTGEIHVELDSELAQVFRDHAPNHAELPVRLWLS